MTVGCGSDRVDRRHGRSATWRSCGAHGGSMRGS